MPQAATRPRKIEGVFQQVTEVFYLQIVIICLLMLFVYLLSRTAKLSQQTLEIIVRLEMDDELPGLGSAQPDFDFRSQMPAQLILH